MKQIAVLFFVVGSALAFSGCESTDCGCESSQANDVMKMEEHREQYQPQAPGN